MNFVKKIIIIDWLDKYGGAERVISILNKIFVFDKTYTLVSIMEDKYLNEIYFSKKPNIKETKLKILKKRFRILFFTFHYFISNIKIDKDVDLIISSSHSVAKGIKKSNQNQLHISYFQARNFNYIWSDYKLYFGYFRFLFHPITLILRKVDKKQSKNPDFIISNSYFVKDWVKEKYRRDSVVIYPPVDLSKFELCKEKEDYYVTVGRLVQVKRFDIAIKAFNKLNKKLIIIGDGVMKKNLMKIASENIEFKGFLDSKEINQIIKKAKGFVQTGVEGFGIAPIEAQATGTPVIAFKSGGVIETVLENKTGIFYENQDENSLVNAIIEFESKKFDYKEIRQHALYFSVERFEKEIKDFVSKKYFEKFNKELF